MTRHAEVHDAEDWFIVHSARHPNESVARFGFPLGHPYLDRCVLARLGPSATALLRRLPDLWYSADPSVVRFEDLATAIGVRTERLSETIHRLVRYGFAERPRRTELRVFTRYAPLTQRELRRLPALVVDSHERLASTHVNRHLNNRDETVDEDTIRGFVERLARLQHPSQVG